MLNDVTEWLRDWRAWVLIGVTILFNLIDLFVHVEAYELVIVVVPVLASVALGRPTLTVVIGLLTVGFMGAHAGVEGYDFDEIGPRILLFGLVTLVSVVLARGVRRRVDDLSAARDQLRFQLENSADVLFRTSHEGVFEYFTPNVVELTGWRPEELVGRVAATLVHPDDRDYLRTVQERVRAGETLRVELRILRPDDSVMWMSVRLRPYRNALGVVRGRTGSWRDVSEQHSAEVALAASERQARLLLENMTDVMVHVRDDAFAWVSPSMQDQLGWTVAELRGASPADYFHPDDLPALGAMVATTDETGEASGRVRVRHKDGSYHWTAARMRRYLGEDGSPDGRVSTLRIVDDEVAAERALMRSQQLLASGLASELDPHVFLGAVMGEDGVIVDLEVQAANPAAAAYFRRPLDGLVGQRLKGDRLVTSEAAMASLTDVARTGESVVWNAARVDDAALTEGSRLDLSATPTADGISVVWRDVTESYQARRAVAESERRFRLLAENSTDVVLHSVDGVVDWVSPSIQRTLGWVPGDWQGRSCELFVHPGDAPVLLDAYDRSSAGEEVGVQIRMRNATGSHNWVEVRSGPYLDSEGASFGIVAAFHRIDAEVAARRELERRASHDELTGLLKRNEVLGRLDDLGSQARHPGQLTAVVFVDLDDFKSVNDTYGHGVGDALLVRVAQRIRGCVRAGDTVARMGGDEFLVILEGLHSLAEGEAVADKIRASIELPVEIDDAEVRSSASIGVTLVSPIERADQMVARADEAMYSAKSRGRNRVIAIPDP